MIPKIYTIHGIKNYDTYYAFHNYLARILNEMEMDAEPIFYGYLPAIKARWKDKSIAEQLCDEIPDGSIVCGHSNGAALIYLMDQMGKNFGGVVLVQPALDCDKYIKNTPWVHVYFNPQDRVVSLGAILIGHLFGEQGRYGPDMTNWPKEIKEKYTQLVDTTAQDDDMPDAPKHSWFDGEFGDIWFNEIGEKIRNEYGL